MFQSSLIFRNAISDSEKWPGFNDWISYRIPEGKAPRFPKKPTIRQEGDSLILECVCEAHPFPEVTWYLGSKKIMEGARHKTARKEISKHTYQLSLEIRVR